MRLTSTPTDAGPRVGRRPGAAGLLLAAGAGRRMGRPKALVEIDGEPLVARGIRLLADGGARPVVVIAGAAAPQVEAVAAALTTVTPVRLVRAQRWAEGLGASLRAGLAAAADLDVDAVVVALVDQPDLVAAAVRRLIGAAAPGGGYPHPALTASYQGRAGHPVLLRRAVWERVAASAVGDVGARAWLRAHPAEVGLVPCDGLGSPRDVDTPADLAASRAGPDHGRRGPRDLREDADMELSVIDNPDRHRHEARTPEGELAGLVQYQRRPDRIVFVHTEVLPEYEGRGVGSALAAAALDAARQQGLAVIPECPYIRGYIDRHPDYADLVADVGESRSG
ncbi:GNAT family N-acetyltransferase [Frankia sp. AgB32]|uniref:GNAT family N-acetyltransferase n=1 Tax=Frankia sp. AgB32 TaxID=631119 RepID=UPI00200E36D6|nr:GNAT family N-acetyltransferase [Frankia sp. AgB32]MCK9895658.1 GNAT family N-acetyltransferase [Frankia sp. AgB32]